MASWTDRLTLLVDAVTKDASKNLRGVQGDLSKTDDAAKSGAKGLGGLSSAFESVTGFSLGTAAAVGAVAKVAADSLTKFTGLAKETLNMSDALGISTESASRWIAVADDYQVSTEAISKGLLSVEKSAASGGAAIERAGGQIQRARDGSVDVDATMESVATGLAAIHDPAQRAAAATGLFGKNWATIAPLMAEGGAAIDSAMGSVSNAQTITEDEAASAERMRLAQDKLSDAVGDLMLQLGALLAQFAPLIDTVATGIEWYGKYTEAIDTLEKRLGPFGEALKSFTNPIGFVGDAIGFLTGKSKDAKPPVNDLSDALNEGADAATAMDDAFKLMSGTLDSQSALLRTKDAIDDVIKANNAAAKSATTGGADQVAAYRKSQEQSISAKQDVIRYAQTLANIPPAKVTEINAAIDRGDYVEANRLLDELSRNRTARIDINAFASLTIPAGTPGTIRTYLPGQYGRRSTTPTGSVDTLAAQPAAAGFGAPAPAPSGATLVVQIHAPSIGNPTHISDAVVAGYNRALRLAGPRAVTVPASGVPWTS